MSDVTPKKYPKAWYPVALSREVSPGQVRNLEVFGKNWTLFRGQSGKAGLIQKHCSHMGTDLSNAKVVGDQLVCPFHLWKYDHRGSCSVLTKNGSKEIGKLLFNVHEAHGIIFAFPGETAEFEFPKYTRISEAGLALSGMVVTRSLRTPYESLIFNGFDPHHLECIHYRKISRAPILSQLSEFHFRGDFAMKVAGNTGYDRIVRMLGSDDQNFILDIWGGNYMMITNERTKDNMVICSVPINAENSRIFIYAVTEKKNSALVNFGAKVRLGITSYLGGKFLEPDVRIVEGMRPDQRNLINDYDAPVAEFWNYLEQIPTFDL